MGSRGLRYVGLIATGGHHAIDPSGLLVKPEPALAQIEREQGVSQPAPHGHTEGGREPQPGPPGAGLPRRFYASVSIGPNRAGRDVGRIAEEVLQHLTTLSGANDHVTLDVGADVPEGVPEDVQRVVTENCQTLKFTSHCFESD